MNTFISYDAELVPVGFDTFDAEQVRGYDQLLSNMGSKSAPMILPRIGGQFHPDGLATEFAPLEPSSSVAEFLASYTRLKQKAERMIGGKLCGVDWVDISRNPEFNVYNAPYLYELAHVLGCSQDWDEHGPRTKVPEEIKSSPIKEIGFHIHVDVHPKFREEESQIVPIVLEYEQAINFLRPEWTAPRDPWYRRHTVFRPKPYGFEYRSFGSSIVENLTRFTALVQISFLFAQDHMKTHNREYHV